MISQSLCHHHKPPPPPKSGAVDGTLTLIVVSRANAHLTRLPTTFETLFSVVGVVVQPSYLLAFATKRQRHD